MKRGDVFMALIPYLEGGAAKRRPAVIVQADSVASTSRDTVVVAITSNLDLAGPSHRFVIDPARPEDSSSGLRHTSLVRCERLFAMPQSGLGRRIGQLSAVHLAALDACLKATLDLK